MILNIFESYHRKKNYRSSVEYKFFRNNYSYLASYPFLKKYGNLKDDFSLICANVIIQSLMNKKILETTYEYAKLLAKSKASNASEYYQIVKDELIKAKSGLPYLEKNQMSLYIPLFDMTTNLFYEDEIHKLDNYPYSLLKEDFKDSCINPFETYNVSLFSSSFTRLIYIAGDNTSDAFYHLGFETIYFINHQGSLDFIIPLYDKRIKYPVKEDSLEKVHEVVKTYYQSSRSQLIDTLHEKELISDRLYRKLYQDIAKRYKKKKRGTS